MARRSSSRASSARPEQKARRHAQLVWKGVERPVDPRAHRDEVVASYALAASLGWLIPEKMGMADIAYQPGPHYRAMEGKILSMDHVK